MALLTRWSTWTDICNYALRQIGAQALSSLTDGSNEAAVCLTHLPASVAVVVESRDWRCLTTRVQLSQTTTTPVNDYKYQYALPSDFLRLALLDEKTDPVETLDEAWDIASTTNPAPQRPVYPYSIEGNYLYTDAPYVYIRYIQQPGDTVSLYPMSFLVAIAAELAAEIIYPLTSDPVLQTNLIKVAAQRLVDAITADSSKDQAEEDPQQRGYDWYDELRGTSSDLWGVM